VAKIIHTDEIFLSDLDTEQQDWLYNAKDCCITHEVNTGLNPRIDANRERIYRFEMAQQAVAWAMTSRGTKIDLNARDSALHELGQERSRMNNYINELAQMMWGRGLNPKSPPQMQEFFYGFLKLPTQYRQDAGRKVPTTNIDALETFRAYHYIQPVVNAILASGDLHGQIKVLAAGVDDDGRFRSSFNVGGAETGRWSSSKNPAGRGSNNQNVTPRARHIFIADPGEILVGPDLEQAESRAVAYLSGDTNYIRACESGDLHTSVAQLIWPEAGWPDNPAGCKRLAKDPGFYRHWSRRDLSKRGGHLTNYWGTHYKLAAALHLELDIAERFQNDYFAAFPGITAWHRWVAQEIQTTSHLTTPFGRERTFFGRTDSDRTIKEAIACVPQSTIADLFNLGLLRVWHHLELKEGLIHCLMQVHDGAIIGVPEDKLDVILPRMQELMTIPLMVNGREMTVPLEFKVGYNWRDMEVYGSEAASKLTRESDALDPLRWRAG